jgi:large subunit ribosomal protein L25
MVIEIKAEVRGENEKLETLRKGGFLPSVVYGKKFKPTNIKLEQVAFKKVWQKAGESSVVSLSLGNEILDCLIKEVQLDPIKDIPVHADFYALEKGQKVKVRVPVEFIGVSPAVKDLGAVLVKVMHDLEIEAAPKDLPHRIEVDISSLDVFGSQIFAKSAKLPSGVVLLENPDEVVASVYEPKEEKIEEVPVDLSAIEVEKKGKKEEEGTTPEAGGASVEKSGSESPKK